MPLKKEPCRNFQRGSCRFGDKCKFLHVTQQQPKPNVFGFGSQTSLPFQQQKPNPFGFGVQNSGPAAGAPSSGGFNQSNGFKPFENKWVRPEQPANQSQSASHMCTDPDSCKRLIAEDFEQERPLWKLTCYGHYKYLPCDITGDISYEELRIAAYDEAKRGIGLQSIVERERNLLNAKLVEFENLLRNPYPKQTHPAQSNQNPFPAVGPSTPSLTAQNTAPAPVSSFGQLGSSPNMTFGVRPSVPSNNAFGQFQGSPGPFGTNNIPSGPFGSQVPVQTGGIPFTSNVAGLANGGLSSQGSQVPAQTDGSPFASNIAGFSNIGMNSQGSQLHPTSSVFPQIQTSAVNQSPMLSNGSGVTKGVEQVSANTKVIGNVHPEVSSVDASIWLKEEWKLGEIPEQPPPAAFVK